MKKSLLFVSISLVALLGITSCNNNSNDSSSTSPVSSSTTVTSSSTTNPSSTTTPASSSSSTTPSGFEDDTPKPTEENLPEGTVVRDYNPAFDTMVDDFSGETSTGTLSDTGATYQSKPYLKVALHSKWDEGTTSDSERMVPTTPDRAIYKMATGTYDLVSMDAIGFRVRLATGSTPIALSNLIFGCRGADTVQVYPINLANAVDADSSPLEEIGYEYKDLMISVKNSVDDNVMYANPDGTASSLQVTSTMLGFHLYATGDFKGDIEIEEVFAIKGSTRTVIDNFNRATVGNGLENAYWAGSTGTIEGRRAVINEGGSYKVSKADATPAANVALSVKGDSTGLTVTPVKANGDEGTAVAWSELKDSEGKALPTILKNTYASYVVDIEKSGLGSDVVGVKLSSTTEVSVNKVFLTDLVDVVAQDYPAIERTGVFDNFNRTQNSFTSDWDASATDPIVVNAGLNGCVSYNGAELISIGNGALKLGATDDYINFVEGSKTGVEGAKYLVFRMKTEGTLDNFRIMVDNMSQPVYFNDWYAAPGTLSKDTPYVDSTSGYSLYVIDLEESGLGSMKDQITFFYTGTADLFIDEVFYANDMSRETKVVSAKLNEADLVADFSTGDYVYVGNCYVGDSDIVAVTLKGDGETTLEAIRFELGGKQAWFKDGIVDVHGDLIDYTTALSTEDVTYYIPLRANGLEKGDGTLHIHAGAYNGIKGSLTITALGTYNYVPNTKVVMAENKEVSNNAYNYICGNDGHIAGPKYLTMVVTGDLSTMRIEDAAGNEWWAKDGKIILADGSVLDASTPFAEETTIVIDLVATGLSNNVQIHIHNGGAVDTTVTYKSITLTADNLNYSEIMSALFPAEVE
ncbi:unknown [Clostridium sp. CAG:288]|nr:unknown [Clostridium sp. CAG:288]